MDARRVRLIVRVVTAAAVLLVVLAGVQFVRTLPPEHSPFAKLDLERPLGWATDMQLGPIRADPAACSAALAASAIAVTPIADERTGLDGACGFTNAVVLDRTHIAYSQPTRVTCPVAAALYLWEREVVTPAAAASLESPVVRIETAGTYSCRRVYGRTAGRLSEHATANAIDITGFRLENGRTVQVERGWDLEGPDAIFLRAVRDGGCRVFQGVYSPDYNQAHADHLHFDAGPFGLCR